MTTSAAKEAAAAELDDEEEDELRLVVFDSTRVDADDEDDREWACGFDVGGRAGDAPGGVADGADGGAVCRCRVVTELDGTGCVVDSDVDKNDDEGVRSKLASVVS